MTDLEKMDLAELACYIDNRIENNEPFTQNERMELHDVLGRKIAWAGALWDQVDGTDPRRFQAPYGGTGNRRSMTYKCRKLAGYSYP